jgi:hypothetical protein
MLSDSIVLLPGASVEIKVQQVTTLPAVTTARLVYLTQSYSSYTPGIYVGVDGTWKQVTVDTNLSSAVASANSYTDAETASTLASANSYTDSQVTSGVTSANGYTDTKVATVGAYDIASMVSGKPSASSVLMRFKLPRSITIPANFAGSQSVAVTAGTVSSAVFTILKNGTSIGTFTFSVNGTTAAFSATSAISCTQGDVITITAPSSQNATLADIAWTIAASIT